MNLIAEKKQDRTILRIPGDLTIGDFVSFKNNIENLIANGAKFIDLDMKQVRMVDSSNLRLLINLHRRLHAEGGDLSFFGISEAVWKIFAAANLEKVFAIRSTEEDLEPHSGKKPAKDFFEFWNVALLSPSPIRKVPLKCPLCGSLHVHGYVLSPRKRNLRWRQNRLLPDFEETGEEKDTDFYRVFPAVCADCLLSSTHLQDFIVVKGDVEFRPSRLELNARNSLSRNLARRRKILDTGIAVGDNFFEHPRTDAAVLAAYRLAEDCSRNLSIDREQADAFSLGFTNTVLAGFSPSAEEPACLDRARIWFMEVLKTPEKYTPEQVGQSRYFVFACCLHNDRKKEAKEALIGLENLLRMTKDPSVKEEILFYHEHAVELRDDALKRGDG